MDGGSAQRRADQKNREIPLAQRSHNQNPPHPPEAENHPEKPNGVWGWAVLIFRWIGRALDKMSPFITAAATAAMVLVGYWQWRALHETDASIRRQLSLMEADQRPWVILEFGSYKVSASTKTPNGTEFAFEIKLKNVGRVPASGVQFSVRQIPNELTDTAQILAAEARACPKPEAPEQHRQGDLIFPNEPAVTHRAKGLVGDKEIERYSRFFPKFVGCITYWWQDKPLRVAFIWVMKIDADERVDFLQPIDDKRLRLFWYQEDGKDVGKIFD